MTDDLPTGTVTFLFTDVEGSTKLLHELGAAAYAEALAAHRRVIREACANEGGVEVDTQGDAFFFAFSSAPGGVAAAQALTEALASGPIQVRIGLHTGEPLLSDERYIGDDVHFAARVAATSHGGQVVLSKATAELVELELRDLGEHRLKDIPEAVAIYQLGNGSFPPLKTISNTNLPRPASSFVGRDDELLEVLSRFEDGARLVTLTGPGGTGKTRLAIEAASELIPEFKAGVFWVGLATLRDHALVTETISQTLGAKDGLAEHIGERNLLLLLDNLEQVIDCAPELGSLLETCPNLSLLVTSRELLRISGELEYAVPPLAEQEAIDLFCARSQLDASDTIVELCRHLDDMPLAVELAAARTSALTPQQILDRLAQRLDLLKGGRDADPRQQTLRATIEWSYELLSSDEQQLFARLSVFAGGCTLEAAEEVCDADLDTLQSLIEKSLLRFTEGRYWMLETIRDYASERLAEVGDADALLERVCGQLRAVAAAEGAPFFAGRQSAAFARLEPEYANTRAVMEWALGRHRYGLAAELIGLLRDVWMVRGHENEALRWTSAVLQQRGAVPDQLRIEVLIAAGDLMKLTDDLRGAGRVAKELISVATDDPNVDQLYVAAALADLSDIARRDGDFEGADKYAQRSLEFRIARGLPGARAFSSLAELALEEGDLERAERLFERAAEDYAGFGHDMNFVGARKGSGEVARRRGDTTGATELFSEALRVSLELGDQGAVADCLLDLALVERDRRHMERAARLWGAGQAVREKLGRRDMPLGRRREEIDVPEEGKAKGAAMTLEEAVEYALASID